MGVAAKRYDACRFELRRLVGVGVVLEHSERQEPEQHGVEERDAVQRHAGDGVGITLALQGNCEIGLEQITGKQGRQDKGCHHQQEAQGEGLLMEPVKKRLHSQPVPPKAGFGKVARPPSHETLAAWARILDSESLSSVAPRRESRRIASRKRLVKCLVMLVPAAPAEPPTGP